MLKKFKDGGVENALFDAPGRGRNAEITDDEKAWIINITCQKPVDLGYSAEVWTRALLTKHINKFVEEAGYIQLSVKGFAKYLKRRISSLIRSYTTARTTTLILIRRCIMSSWSTNS